MILHPLRWLQRTSLVTQIVIAMFAGIALAAFFPAATPKVALLGTLFISALKAVAPVLVFILVIAAISNHKPGEATHMRPVLFLYLVGTLVASVVGVRPVCGFRPHWCCKPRRRRLTPPCTSRMCC